MPQYRSIQQVLGEIGYIEIRYGLFAVYIEDSMFALNNLRTNLLLDGIRKLYVAFRCKEDMASINTIQAMIRAGCKEHTNLPVKSSSARDRYPKPSNNQI